MFRGAVALSSARAAAEAGRTTLHLTISEGPSTLACVGMGRKMQDPSLEISGA